MTKLFSFLFICFLSSFAFSYTLEDLLGGTVTVQTLVDEGIRVKDLVTANNMGLDKANRTKLTELKKEEKLLLPITNLIWTSRKCNCFLCRQLKAAFL